MNVNRTFETFSFEILQVHQYKETVQPIFQDNTKLFDFFVPPYDKFIFYCDDRGSGE